MVDIPESRGANRVDAGISEQPTLVDALDKKKSDEYTARASAKYVIYLVIFVAIIMAVYFATYKALVDNIKTPAEPIKIENPDAHSIHSITHIGNSLSLFRHQ